MRDRRRLVRFVSRGRGRRRVGWCLALMAFTGCSDPARPDRALSGEAIDRTTLVAMYDAMGGPNWTANDNWLSDRPLGEWNGIRTNAEGRVTAIRLEENGLSGSIPGELSQLRNLEELRLDGNDITGPIPPELGVLSDLNTVSVADNRINGSIPTQLVRLGQLVVLDLDENQLGGGIPPQFGDLPNLLTLSARNNNLAGEIPARLGQTPRLRRILLSGNRFSGPVPAELGGLAGLEELHLDHNQLTGELPGTLIGLPMNHLTWHQNDGLCAPAGAAMVEWLASIDFTEGPRC